MAAMAEEAMAATVEEATAATAACTAAEEATAATVSRHIPFGGSFCEKFQLSTYNQSINVANKQVAADTDAADTVTEVSLKAVLSRPAAPVPPVEQAAPVREVQKQHQLLSSRATSATIPTILPFQPYLLTLSYQTRL